MVRNHTLLTIAVAIMALMMVAPVAVMAQSEDPEPVMVEVVVEGFAPVELASLDHANSNAEEDGVCFAHSDDIYFAQGTNEVGTSGSYNSVRFVNDEGVMIWEILPRSAHGVNDPSQPMWVSEYSPLCTLSEVVALVMQQIPEVAAEEETVEISGLVSYLESDMFGPIWYGGPFFGGLVNPAEDLRCHADQTSGGIYKYGGDPIVNENWTRVQIHNEMVGTPEYDYAVGPGTITITEPGTIIRWWDMVNCNEWSANRDAAASPGRRKSNALANTAGYVRNWESHPSAEWFDYTPAN